LQKMGQAPGSFSSFPFSADAERARSQGLASIGNLIQSLPAASPKTVTLAFALLDRFLLTETCRHFRAGLEASTPFSQISRNGQQIPPPFSCAAAGHPASVFHPCVQTCRNMVACPCSCRLPRLCVLCTLAVLVKDVHDAKLHVIFTLNWNIDPLAAIDVAQKLLYMAPRPTLRLMLLKEREMQAQTS